MHKSHWLSQSCDLHVTCMYTDHTNPGEVQYYYGIPPYVPSQMAMTASGGLVYMGVDATVLLLSYHLNQPLPLGLYRQLPRTPQQHTLNLTPSLPHPYPPPPPSSISNHICLISAINKNHLAFFLLANVFTGAVNLWTDTLHTSDVVAVYILLVYMFVLCHFFHVAQKLGLATKFW